jgi:RNA polymerase sigma-70 factor, ECF subfamily
MRLSLTSAHVKDEAGMPVDGPEVEFAVSADYLERILAARITAGDVGAFSALLDRFWEPLVRYAHQLLGSQDAAEDVAQEAFVRLWAKRAALKADTSPRAYLYRLVHNLAIDELRMREVRGRRGRLSQPEPLYPPTPAQVTEADELAEVAAEAIQALPSRRRDVFVLGHFHDMSYREIAEALDITPRTVANHMTLALRDLRHALRPYLEGLG